MSKITFTDNNIISLEPLKYLNKLFNIGVADNISLPLDEILKFEKIIELNLSINNQMIGEIKNYLI